MTKTMRKRVALGAVFALGLVLGCGPDKGADSRKTSDKEGSSGPGPAREAVEVIVEAETMASKGLFSIVDDADAAGGKAVRVPLKEECPDHSGDVPEGNLAFELDLKADANVTIWCRVKWDDTCSNSFTLILPGMKKTVTGSTLKKWFWVAAVKKLELKAGKHTLSIAAREYGAHIDQILVTDDADRVPRGVATNFKEMAKE